MRIQKLKAIVSTFPSMLYAFIQPALNKLVHLFVRTRTSAGWFTSAGYAERWHTTSWESASLSLERWNVCRFISETAGTISKFLFYFCPLQLLNNAYKSLSPPALSDHYSFVTFYNTEDAFAAIDNGGKLRRPNELPFDLCFGGRRQFCNSDYADLGEKHFSAHFSFNRRKKHF